ncbi:hypothetical protein, partial [Paraburkholderia kururiensis]|uniref:hypothetical protein n=1 Tax=Paraburkholderia kururiensis TaxID=984307 RepID=UPI0018F2E591
MHIVAGAVIGGLGGGSAMAAAGGAAGAGVSAALAPKLNDLSRAVADAAPTGNATADRVIGNVVANVAAGAAGGLVGGNAGAFAASNEDAYNRQLHDDEKQTLAKLQQGETDEEKARLADAACYLVQCAAQMSDNDPAKAAAQDSQNRGAGYVTEQRELRSTGLFVYNPLYDAASDLLSRTADWALQQAKSAGRSAADMGNQFVGKMNGDAQRKASEPRTDLMAQGAATGLGAGVGMEGGGPTAGPGLARA